MTYRPLLWSLVAIALLALPACKMMTPFISKPTVSYEKMTLQGASLFDADLLFTFNVHNPNPVGINVRQGTYDFAIEGSSMASGTVDRQLSVAGGGTGSIDLPVHVNFMDLFDSIAALAHHDRVAYTLSGSFDVMGFTIPYKTEGELPLPSLPEVSVASMSVSDVSLFGARLDIILAVNNPNAFAIGLDQLAYSLDIGDIPILSGETENIRQIDENKAATIAVPVKLDALSMGRAAMRLLDGSTAPYSIRGEMRFSTPGGGTRTLPFSRSGEASLGHR